jgi:hypothetical protein
MVPAWKPWTKDLPSAGSMEMRKGVAILASVAACGIARRPL